MKIPIGIIKEWRRRQEEQMRKEDEARKPQHMPLPEPHRRGPRGSGDDEKKRRRIVINIS